MSMMGMMIVTMPMVTMRKKMTLKMGMIMTVGRLVQAQIQRFVNQKKVHLSAALCCLLQYHYHGEDDDRGGSDHHCCNDKRLLNMEERSYDSK